MARSIWTCNCPNEVAPLAASWLEEQGFTLIGGMVAKTPQFVRLDGQNLPKFSIWITWYEQVFTQHQMDNLDPYYFDTPFECVITDEGDTTQAFECFLLGSDQTIMLAAHKG